jgi:hypothetical protein
MIIKKNNHTVYLFPTRLILNNFTAGIIRRKLKKDGINVTKKQILPIIKEIKRYKKRNSNWIFAEINEKNGTYISWRI